MSVHVPHEAGAHEHVELSFVRRYIFSTDHKIIGIQFLFSSLIFLMIGGLLAMLYSFSPSFGGPFLLRAFVVIVVGGLESFSGVAIGALILALAETFSILVLPASYQPAIAFSLLVLALVVLPEGVAGLWIKRRRWA